MDKTHQQLLRCNTSPRREKVLGERQLHDHAGHQLGFSDFPCCMWKKSEPYFISVNFCPFLYRSCSGYRLRHRVRFDLLMWGSNRV